LLIAARLEHSNSGKQTETIEERVGE